MQGRDYIIDDSAENPPAGVDTTPLEHPGAILKDEFLDPLGVSQYRLAKETGLTQSHVSKIVRGETSITARVATRLSAFFGTSAEFWLNLQAQSDLEDARNDDALAQIKRYDAAS